MERITLQIEGLPQLVYVGRTYQYRIMVRNHETRSVTVVLKCNQNDLVYGVTVPASGSKDVEVRGEFENAGSQIVAYTIMKSGKVLDSKSQLVEIKTPPAEVERPKSTSWSTTWPALPVLLIFALVIVIAVFWPQISGFFKGQIPKELNTSTPVPSIAVGIDPETGAYGNYYLGLVREPTGVQVDSYGNLVVLINNRSAQNPTYTHLLDFLSSDKTDLYPFHATLAPIPSRYGRLENYVDLGYEKEIIDGTIQPNPPRVCADYAQMLHNNAEMAGIRCAFASVALNGPIYNHALNAFETTDRGLIYIDATGTDESHNCDKVVHVEIGKSYVPQSLFPTPGWSSTWESSGTVTDIFMTWDGDWNK